MLKLTLKPQSCAYLEEKPITYVVPGKVQWIRTGLGGQGCDIFTEYSALSVEESAEEVARMLDKELHRRRAESDQSPGISRRREPPPLRPGIRPRAVDYDDAIEFERDLRKWERMIF